MQPQKTNVVGWFEIYVQDMNRAKFFYETVFNIQMTEVPTEGMGEEFQMTFFPWVENAPCAPGAIVKAQGVPSGGNSTMVYFNSDDCAVEESRVESASGKILKPKFSIGEYGFCSICQDTEGNAFGIHSMK